MSTVTLDNAKVERQPLVFEKLIDAVVRRQVELGRHRCLVGA